MITRDRNYEKHLPSKNAHKIYIVCEGKGTEPDYFGFFQGLSSNLEIIPIPPEGGTDPIKLKELAISKFFTRDGKFFIDYRLHETVWFVIDTDDWERTGKITSRRFFCESINSKDASHWKEFSEVKPYSVCNVAQSNPCFELWLYYHFFAERPEKREVEQYVSFKEFVNEAINGGFDFKQDPVRMQDATSNARKTFASSGDNLIDLYSTEVYRLAEEILPFVGRDLQRLRNKM